MAHDSCSAWLIRPSPQIAPHLETGDILIDGGNSYYIDDIRRSKELEPKGINYVDVGTSGGVWGLERGYCMMIGGPHDAVQHLDPIFKTIAPGSGTLPHARPRETRRHCRGRLPALRPQRRRPLRQDGAQRYRVRHHGRVRRGPEHPAATPTSASISTRSTPRPRRCAIPSTTSTNSTWPTSPRSGGAAASSPHGCSISRPPLSTGDPQLAKFEGRVSDSGEGRWTIKAAIDEAVPASSAHQRAL